MNNFFNLTFPMVGSFSNLLSHIFSFVFSSTVFSFIFSMGWFYLYIRFILPDFRMYFWATWYQDEKKFLKRFELSKIDLEDIELNQFIWENEALLKTKSYSYASLLEGIYHNILVFFIFFIPSIPTFLALSLQLTILYSRGLS